MNRTLYLLLKAKAAAQGETHTWADGKTRKKVGKKWVVVAGGQKSEERQKADSWRRAQESLAYALSTVHGDSVDMVLQKYNLNGVDDIIEYLKDKPPGAASQLYREAVDDIRAMPGTPKDKQAAIKLFGQALIQIRDQYVSQPKEKLKIKKTSKTGKTYYEYDEGKHTDELPLIKPSVLKKEKAKMGGWTVTGNLSTTHVRKMLETGAAKLVSGNIDGRKPWVMPDKAEDMDLSYTGKALTIHVKQVEKKKKRTRATAKVDIKIPYAYAKAFLLNQIDRKRTRNNFIFRMERSKGYRDYLDRAGA